MWMEIRCMTGRKCYQSMCNRGSYPQLTKIIQPCGEHTPTLCIKKEQQTAPILQHRNQGNGKTNQDWTFTHKVQARSSIIVYYQYYYFKQQMPTQVHYKSHTATNVGM
jgi:hypothetical protein